MFTTNPTIRLDPIHGWPLRLQSELRYHHEKWGEIVVPVTTKTDLASVPRIFWRIIPPFGRYSRAAIVHDYLCERGKAGVSHNNMSSKAAHKVFRDAMKELKVPGWKRGLMYTAVRCFGPRWTGLD